MTVSELELGFYEPELDQISTLDRLEVLVQDPRAGFLPTTKGEITEAISLIDCIGKPGEAGRHLNEILRHQLKAETDDPKQAVRSVTGQYKGYAKGARRDLTFLELLAEEVAACDNPIISLKEEFGSDHPGLRQLVRYIDLKRIAETKSTEAFDFDPIKSVVTRNAKGKHNADPYLARNKDVDIEQHINDTLEETTIGVVRKIVLEAVADQRKRYVFWVERLKETRSHSVARPIAEAALREFGVRLT